MEIYPAIDLMNGAVVRLRRGNPSDVIHYNSLGSPLDVALMWESKGSQMLHVIDIDSALGRGNNFSVIKDIARGTSIPVQAGGGFRDISTIARALNRYTQRIILGTLAIQNPGKVIQLGNEFGFDRIVVSLDYKQNQVVKQGWQEVIDQTPGALLESLRSEGFCHFLMTAVEHDGCMSGPDQNLGAVSDTVSDIIVAGGVSSIGDVKTLALRGFEGAVLGRALYENEISLEDAIQAGRSVI